MLKFMLVFLLKRYKNRLINEFDKQDSIPFRNTSQHQWLADRNEIQAAFRFKNKKIDAIIHMIEEG